MASSVAAFARTLPIEARRPQRCYTGCRRPAGAAMAGLVLAEQPHPKRGWMPLPLDTARRDHRACARMRSSADTLQVIRVVEN